MRSIKTATWVWAFILLILGGTFFAGLYVRAQGSILILTSAGQAVFEGIRGGIAAIAAGLGPDGRLYVVERGTSLPFLRTYAADGRPMETRLIPIVQGLPFAIGRGGQVYVAEREGTVRAYSSTGVPLGAFPVLETPSSMAVLSNGTLVVARPGRTPHLLGLYLPDGRVGRTFGARGQFDARPDQNTFLNTALIAVGPGDEIYVAFRYVHPAVVRKYSAAGTLLAEFTVQGSGIESQREHFERGAAYFSRTGNVGGVSIINDLTVDPTTGNLWVAGNGRGDTAVLYEYDASDVKLHEYALSAPAEQVLAPDAGLVLAPDALVVRGGIAYVLDRGKVFRFVIGRASVRTKRGVVAKIPAVAWLLRPFLLQGSCPAAVETPCSIRATLRAARPQTQTAMLLSGAW